MIVVKVELHSAVTGQVINLSTMVISNDCSSKDPDLGNYNVRTFKKGTPIDKMGFTKPLRFGRVEKHLRKKLPVWNLVSKALKAVRYK